jgi:hypothetical protein
MAIAIVNQTTASLTNTSYVVTIPAATAGNTMVVSVTTVAGSGPANFVDHVVDSDLLFPYYSQTASGTRSNDGGISRTTNVFYRTNLSGGENQIYVVPNNGSGMNMYVVIYELSGVNYTTPVENNQVTSLAADNTTTTTGPSITTAFTNAFFVTCGARASAASWSFTAGSGFNQTLSVSAGVTNHLHGYKIASGTNQVAMNHSTGTAPVVIGLADFNPTPNPPKAMLLFFD